MRSNKFSIRKRWLEKIAIALNVFYVKKEKSILMFQNKLKSWKTGYSFSDSKRMLQCIEEHLLSFLLIGCIVALLFFIQSGKSIYDPRQFEFILWHSQYNKWT